MNTALHGGGGEGVSRDRQKLLRDLYTTPNGNAPVK